MSDSSLEVNEIKKGLAKLLSERMCLIPFVERGASFEGWLQIELCDILNKEGSKIISEFRIEKGRGIDIVVEKGDEPKYAIELKVIPKKQMNLREILNDIDKLEKFQKNKTVISLIIFIIFPVDENNANTDGCWISQQSHHVSWEILNKIKEKVSLDSRKFTFFNKTNGIIHLGTLKNGS